MYNPVAQRRRAKCERVSSSLPEDPEYYQESPVSFTSEDLDTEALEMITQGRRHRKRMGNLPKGLLKPTHKPSWDDCTIIPPKEKPPRLNQSLGVFRKRSSGNRCSLHHTRSRKWQGGQRNKVKARRVGDGWDISIRPSKRYNRSNNQRPPAYFKRRSNLSAFPSTNNTLYKKKSVVFHPEPVAYAQANYPGKNFQRSNIKPRKSLNTEKETTWCSPIKKIQRPACDKSECCQMASGCRPVANKSMCNSASCPQANDPKKVKYCNESQRGEQVDTWKSDSGRLTTTESKAFRYLAKRFLNKDFQYPSPIAPGKKQTNGKQNPGDLPVYCFNRPASNCRSPQYVDKTADAWAFPEGLQRRGRSKSRTSQNKHMSDFMPRSKSLGNYKFNDRPKEFGRRIPFIHPEPIDACTKAMSDLQLKENELIDRYGQSPTESNIDYNCACCPNHQVNTCKTRPWDSSLAFNDGSCKDNVSNPFYEVQSYDSSYMKKPHSWNPSRLERNFSQNRYSYGSARSRNSFGPAGGFTRHYNPPFNVTASSDLPWSSALKMSVLQPRSSNSVPCAEIRLMNKYLDDAGVSGLSRRSKTSTSPLQRESNVTQESNNSQVDGEGQVRPSTPPWRKIEGIKDYTSKDYKLEKLPDRKSSSVLPMRRTFQNFLGSWKGGAAGRYSNFSTDFSGLERILSSSEGGKNATDTNCNVPKGNAHSLDQLGSDIVSTGVFSKGVPSSTNLCKFLNFDGNQATSQRPAGMMPSLMSDWQAEKTSGLRPVDSYLNEEKERLRRIGNILG